MSHGSDIGTESQPTGFLTDKPRIRNLVLVVGAIVTWMSLDVALSLIFREYPVGFDGENPTLQSFAAGCILVMVAIGITFILAKTAASRHLVIYVAVGFAIMASAILLANISDLADTQTAIRSFAAAIVGSAALAATAIAYSSSTSKPLFDQLRILVPERRQFIAFAWPMAAWALLVVAWQFTPFNPLTHPDAPDPIIRLNSAFDENLSATIIYLAILVPIAEELFFRGMIITFLANATNAAIAVIISAFVFALFHIDPSYFSINQVIYIFCLAAIFGAAAIITKSIWPGVLVHAFNNALATLQSVAWTT